MKPMLIFQLHNSKWWMVDWSHHFQCGIDCLLMIFGANIWSLIHRGYICRLVMSAILSCFYKQMNHKAKLYVLEKEKVTKGFITFYKLIDFFLQVIRLACGGFVLAHTFNHSICDTHGAYLFIIALSEFCLVRFVFGEEENLLKESRKLHSSLVSIFCFL